MTARTHDVIAFASLLTASKFFPPASLNFLTLMASLVGNIVGALSPDLDQASNRLWDLLPGGNFIGKVFRPLFLGHRNLSHSLLGGFVYAKIVGWVLPRILNPQFVDIKIIFASILIGYVSHLAADGLTEEGLPLFFPLKLKVGFPPIRSWRIKTGQWFENLVVLPATTGYLIWFCIVYRESLVSLLRLINS